MERLEKIDIGCERRPTRLTNRLDHILAWSQRPPREARKLPMVHTEWPHRQPARGEGVEVGAAVASDGVLHGEAEVLISSQLCGTGSPGDENASG